MYDCSPNMPSLQGSLFLVSHALKFTGVYETMPYGLVLLLDSTDVWKAETK